MSGFGQFTFGVSPFGAGSAAPPAAANVLSVPNISVGTSPPAAYPIATQIIPQYLYVEYSDDDDLQAMFATWNAMAQGYISWFNATPLALYTGPNMVGPLLDWCAEGIFGISRPIISTLKTLFQGGLNALPINSVAVNGNVLTQTGSAVIASDDIYKRVLTWWLYRGDGPQMTTQWIKRRVARFLAGINGSDVTYPTASNPSVVWSIADTVIVGAVNTMAANTMAMNASGVVGSRTGAQTATITVPSSSIAMTMQTLIADGVLGLPFQYQFVVSLT